MKKFLIFFNGCNKKKQADSRHSEIGYGFNEDEAIEQVKNAAALKGIQFLKGSEIVFQFKCKNRTPNKTEENVLNSLKLLSQNINIQ